MTLADITEKAMAALAMIRVIDLKATLCRPELQCRGDSQPTPQVGVRLRPRRRTPDEHGAGCGQTVPRPTTTRDANGAGANRVPVRVRANRVRVRANGGRVRNPTWSDANPGPSRPRLVRYRVQPARRRHPPM